MPESIVSFVNEAEMSTGESISWLFLAFLLGVVVTAIITGVILSSKNDPFRDNEEDDPPEPAMHIRDGFWVCVECGQEFRLPNRTKQPIVCPNCGEKGADIKTPLEEEDDLEDFRCPVCGSVVQMIDGDKPSYCPNCGIDWEDSDA